MKLFYDCAFLFLFFFIVPVQFEDIDHIKTSLNLANSTNLLSSAASDTPTGLSDELIIFDQSDTGLPSFQAHFPISSSTTSSGDGHRQQV